MKRQWVVNQLAFSSRNAECLAKSLASIGEWRFKAIAPMYQATAEKLLFEVCLNRLESIPSDVRDR
jgi:hypothetical protein